LTLSRNTDSYAELVSYLTSVRGAGDRRQFGGRGTWPGVEVRDEDQDQYLDQDENPSSTLDRDLGRAPDEDSARN